MDALRHETNDAIADGEIVWFWRPDAGAKSRRKIVLRGDGGKKARSPGRSRISRKTIAQGMPVVAGEPVVANACAFCCTRGRGCIGHPAFPAPSPVSRVACSDSSDISCRENAEPRLILGRHAWHNSIESIEGETPTQPGCRASRRSRPRVSRTPPTTAKRRCRTWRPSASPTSGS
jgi:hypothetical protein